MSTVFQPGATSGDVISCCNNNQQMTGKWRITRRTAFALNLNKDGQIPRSLAIPGREGLQQLETLRFGVDCNLNGSPVGWRGLEGVLARIIATRWELEATWSLEFKFLAIGSGKRISERVEGERTAKGKSSDNIGRGYECVGARVSVVTASKIAVV